MTTRATITLSDNATTYLERSGATNKSRHISKRLERTASEVRHARGVLLACGWGVSETADALNALQGYWSTGYTSPLAIAGELADYSADDDDVTSERWRECIAQVGQTPELAHALLTLAQVVADGGRAI